MMMLALKYRPKRLSEIIGQPKIVKSLRRILDNGFTGGAIWLAGPTGAGKTSIAHAIAGELGLSPGAWSWHELDGSACTVAEVRALDAKAAAGSLFREWRICIVNEAHAMSRKAVQAWLTLLERLPKRWIICFTTTEVEDADLFGHFTKPLLDRCLYYRLTNQGLCEAFARHAQAIAQREGLDGRPLATYVNAVKRARNSLRCVLAGIERGDFLAESE